MSENYCVAKLNIEIRSIVKMSLNRPYFLLITKSDKY